MRKTLIMVSLLVTACDAGDSTTADSALSLEPEVTFDCENIREQVVAVSEGKDVELIKIYDPVETGRDERSVSCKGSVISSLGSQRFPIYYRTFEDEDGERFFEYSGEPFLGAPGK